MKKIIVSSLILCSTVALFALDDEAVKVNIQNGVASDIDVRIEKNFKYMDKLIVSMNKSIKSIDKNIVAINGLERNHAQKVTCIMLPILKSQIDNFAAKLTETPSEERMEQLEKVKVIYNRENEKFNCKGERK